MSDFEVNIQVNLPPELTEGGFESTVQDIMDAAGTMAREEWVRLVDSSRLTTTKEQYKLGIGAVETPNDMQRTIRLDGWLPNAQEQGLASFDMKPGILKGRQKVIVPITRGTPGNKELKYPPLPQKVYNDVKNFNMGDRYSDKEIRTSHTGYKHTTGIYDRLGRNKRDPNEGRTPSGNISKSATFTTFRTISVNSDPTSWIHPGFKAILLSEQVKSFVESQLDSLIQNLGA
jgi:hypothetical protein